MINVYSEKALTFGEELVSYLEEEGYRSFDGGEQEDRQALVLSWAAKAQELIDGGETADKAAHTDAPVSFKARVTLDNENETQFNVEYNSLHFAEGIAWFNLNSSLQLALKACTIAYIEYVNDWDDFDDEDEDY